MKLLALLVLLALSTGTAHAQNPNVLRWCTGSATGNYQWAADQIKHEMDTDAFQQIVLVPTTGSLMNLRKLMNNDCDIGFAQQDVVDQYVIENPASHDALVPLKTVYEEYVHILCPVSSGWTKLSDMANATGPKHLIIGPNGSGMAETWRIIRSTNEKKYGSIDVDHHTVDIDGANIVMDSDNTCMLLVSGLNSSDMVAANELSIRTHNKPMLRLLTIDDNALALKKSSDGNFQYKRRAITPHPPEEGRPALYDHLIPGLNIEVLVVRAVLMMRQDYRDALGTKTGRLLRAIGDAQPIIWTRVNPAAD